MKSNRSRLLLSASILGAALLWGSHWASAALGGASGVTIPYAGRLELNGQAVTGTVTFVLDVFNDGGAGAVCWTSPSISVPVYNGAFSLVVGGVPETCVAGREVYLSVKVDQGAGLVALNGRQRVYPGLAALTSGPGDFTVGGTVHLGYSDGRSGAHLLWNLQNGQGYTNFVNNKGAGPGGYTFDNTADGNTLSRLMTADAQGTLDVAQSVGAAGLRLGNVGHGSAYLGLARSNLGLTDYALLQASNGETLLNSAAGQSLHLRVGNVERATLDPSGNFTAVGGLSGNNVYSSGAMTAAGTGGNVAHQCVTRSTTAAYRVSCNAGEVTVGGGAICPSLFRILENSPWNSNDTAPANGTSANAWRSVCQVWGDNGSVTPPNSIYVICCRQ